MAQVDRPRRKPTRHSGGTRYRRQWRPRRRWGGRAGGGIYNAPGAALTLSGTVISTNAALAGDGGEGGHGGNASTATAAPSIRAMPTTAGIRSEALVQTAAQAAAAEGGGFFDLGSVSLGNSTNIFTMNRALGGAGGVGASSGDADGGEGAPGRGRSMVTVAPAAPPMRLVAAQVVRRETVMAAASSMAPEGHSQARPRSWYWLTRPWAGHKRGAGGSGEIANAGFGGTGADAGAGGAAAMHMVATAEGPPVGGAGRGGGMFNALGGDCHPAPKSSDDDPRLARSAPMRQTAAPAEMVAWG